MVAMVLDSADDTVYDDIGPEGRKLVSRLAKLPLLHSLLWLGLLIGPVFYPHSERVRRALLFAVTMWMGYGYSKFVITAASAFLGAWRCHRNNLRPSGDWEREVDATVHSQIAASGGASSRLRCADVVHCVVIPNCKEPVQTLRRTMDTLASQTVRCRVPGALRDYRDWLLSVIAQNLADSSLLASPLLSVPLDRSA